ncbi:hypothetical protein, partial [Escherichia coli]|uniref:hypothetical protein n=1 Tax=Escherichia coli TaxID=562 RepID=UPI0019217B09
RCLTGDLGDLTKRLTLATTSSGARRRACCATCITCWQRNAGANMGTLCAVARTLCAIVLHIAFTA